MFGVLPAWGFYIRHVKDLTFENVELRASQPDLRRVEKVADVAPEVPKDALSR